MGNSIHLTTCDHQATKQLAVNCYLETIDTFVDNEVRFWVEPPLGNSKYQAYMFYTIKTMQCFSSIMLLIAGMLLWRNKKFQSSHY